jgi:hypothetical protein
LLRYDVRLARLGGRQGEHNDDIETEFIAQAVCVFGGFRDSAFVFAWRGKDLGAVSGPEGARRTRSGCTNLESRLARPGDSQFGEIAVREAAQRSGACRDD